MKNRPRSKGLIENFQTEFAKVLGVSLEETEDIRAKVRKAIIECYLNGMAVLLRNNHDLSWKVLFRAAEALDAQAKRVTVRGITDYVGPTFRRKLNREARESLRNPLQEIDKTLNNRVQVLHGGLVGVGGKHSRRSRGSGKS